MSILEPLYESESDFESEKELPELKSNNIVKIQQNNYACPSDWEGTLEDGTNFYSRWRWGTFYFFTYNKKHDDINIYHDQPRILLHSGDEELEDALASGDRDVLTQEAMLKLCGLTIDEKCVIIKGWWEED